MLQHELPPELDGFADINVRVDLGYLGIKSDYRGEQIAIPTKKPRKSRKNPNPPWSEEQKAAHTALSRVRILLEHAIGGMKRSNILVHTFRNRIEYCEDEVIGICAGLWTWFFRVCPPSTPGIFARAVRLALPPMRCEPREGKPAPSAEPVCSPSGRTLVLFLADM